MATSIPHTFTERNTVQTNNTTTYAAVTGIAQASGNFTAGEKYVVIATAQASATGTAIFTDVHVIHGSTEFEGSLATIHVFAASQQETYSFMTVWTAVSSEGLSVEFRGNPSSGASNNTINCVSLLSIQLSTVLTENTDWHFNESTADQALTTGSTQYDGGSITFTPDTPLTVSLLLPVLWGALMAAVLNAASNAINQIYDLEIDRVNKPRRPLPAGTLSLREAWAFTTGGFVLAWVLAWLADPSGRHECFWIVLFTSVLVWAYSAPPLRTKRHGMWANVTIAVPRGMLLKVAGWSTVKTIVDVEPWFIGAIFGLFLLGAASTKDFADIEGDRAGGCRTLPIVYGVKAAAWMISPFFVLPFALIPIRVFSGVLTGNRTLLMILGPVLILYGAYTVYLLVRRSRGAGVHREPPLVDAHVPHDHGGPGAAP